MDYAAVQKLKHRLMQGGGGTVHAVTYSEPASGFVTAFTKATECRLDAAFALACLPTVLSQFMQYHREALRSPECFVGVWYDSGYVYLDVVKVYQNEAEALAVAAGAGQLSYFDVQEGVCRAVERTVH